MAAQGQELAGFGARFGAQVIDLVWLVPLSLLLGTVAVLVNGDLSSGGQAMANLIGALAVLSFWVERQATPGKLVLGLRIIDAKTGQAPDFRQFALRYLGYFLSAIPLCLGFLWMLWDPKRQTWHDKIAGTLVVRVARG